MANTIESTVIKAKYTKKTGSNTYQVYHLETETEQVKLTQPLTTNVTGGTEIPLGTSVQDALQNIKDVADMGGEASDTISSHVSNTSNPHKVTKAQVGLGSVVNAGMDNTPTSGSNNYVKSGGVYSAIDSAKKLTATAQAKADSAYDLANGRSSALVFTSVANLIAGKWTHGSTTETITLGNFKIGDSVFITTSKVSDFWISSISAPLVEKDPSTEAQINSAKDGQSVIVSWANKYVTLVAVETKTDLSSYLTSSSAASTYVKKDDAVSFQSDDIIGWGSFNSGFTPELKTTGVSEGTYSAVTVDTKGRVKQGAQMVVFADSISDTALGNLAVGGIAVIKN